MIVCRNAGNGFTGCGRPVEDLPKVSENAKVTCVCCQAQDILEAYEWELNLEYILVRVQA